jgi:NADH:ubiquinone oxidoreductase subunit 2 (subunit N)
VVGILTSVVGAYYYIRVIQKMYFGKGESTELTASQKIAPVTGVVFLAALLVIFGIFPKLLIF